MSHCTHAQGPASCKSPTCPGRIQYLKIIRTGKINPTVFEEENATDFTIAEYFKEEYNSEAPTELHELAENIVEYANDIEFINHNKKGDEYLTLQDLIEDHTLFNNNCGPVTWAVLDALSSEDVEGYTFEEHTITYKEGIHVAVLAKNDSGEEYILDFTAKQYYKNLPCPLVESKANWEKTIDTYVSMLYQDSRVKK